MIIHTYIILGTTARSHTRPEERRDRGEEEGRRKKKKGEKKTSIYRRESKGVYTCSIPLILASHIYYYYMIECNNTMSISYTSIVVYITSTSIMC